MRDREWVRRANPDFIATTIAQAARKDHFMKQRRL